MDIILLERIEKLGAIGDVVSVKNGYARNYLLPNGKALRANEANRKLFDANREKIEAENAQRRTTAEKESKTVNGAKVQLIRQASNTGQLYGSVSARDIAEALAVDGHKVAKNQIVLDRPIKAIGVQDVRIALHPEVSVSIQVNVARSPEEAELQAQGIDVMAEMFEKEVTGFTETFDPNAEPGEIPAEPGETEEAAVEAAEAAEVAEATESSEATETVEAAKASETEADASGEAEGKTEASGEA